MCLIVSFLLIVCSISAFGQEKEAILLISRSSEWQYFASKKKPVGNWKSADYSKKDAGKAGWKIGKAGFGYGDDDDATIIKMRNKFLKLYIRRPFNVEDPEKIAALVLRMRYDDAFIVYINGKEVMRSPNVATSSKGTRLKERHEAHKDEDKFAKFKLPKLDLKKGVNFIAIEGFNFKLDSSDFSLDPYLLAVMK